MITWETRFNDLNKRCRIDIFEVTSVVKEQNIAFKCKVNCILVQISTFGSMTQSGCWLRKALFNIRRILLANEFNKESNKIVSISLCPYCESSAVTFCEQNGVVQKRDRHAEWKNGEDKICFLGFTRPTRICTSFSPKSEELQPVGYI